MLKVDMKDKDGKLISSTVFADGSGEPDPDRVISESEKFYDDVVAPALADLAKKCHERNMGFEAAVSYESGDGKEYGSTKFLAKNEPFAMRMIDYAIRSEGNIDRFLMVVEKDAKEYSIELEKESIYFKLMRNNTSQDGK